MDPELSNLHSKGKLIYLHLFLENIVIYTMNDEVALSPDDTFNNAKLDNSFCNSHLLWNSIAETTRGLILFQDTVHIN